MGARARPRRRRARACRDTCSTRSARRRGRSRSARASSRGTPRSTATSPSTATARSGRRRCASSRSCPCWAAVCGWISFDHTAGGAARGRERLRARCSARCCTAWRCGRRATPATARRAAWFGALFPAAVRARHGVRGGHRDDARRRRVPRAPLEPVLVGRGRRASWPGCAVRWACCSWCPPRSRRCAAGATRRPSRGCRAVGRRRVARWPARSPTWRGWASSSATSGSRSRSRTGPRCGAASRTRSPGPSTRSATSSAATGSDPASTSCGRSCSSLLLVVLVRRFPASYSLYGAATLLLGLSAQNLDSFERYCWSTFPFLLALAAVTDREEVERGAYVLAAAGPGGLRRPWRSWASRGPDRSGAAGPGTRSRSADGP